MIMSASCAYVRPVVCHHILKRLNSKSCGSLLCPNYHSDKRWSRKKIIGLRDLSGTAGPPKQPTAKESLASSEPKNGKLNTAAKPAPSDKLLHNYKPHNESTKKLLQTLQEWYKRISENAILFYNEKRNSFATKGEGGLEEDWYSARVSFWMKQYENFVGLTAVKEAQVKVIRTEKALVNAQDDRRETQRLINDVQAKIKNILV